MRCTAKITAFKTPDGKLFETETAAIDAIIKELEEKYMNIIREEIKKRSVFAFDAFQCLREIYREFGEEYSRLRKLWSEAASRAEPRDNDYK